MAGPQHASQHAVVDVHGAPGAVEPHGADDGHGAVEHERPEDWGWHADFGKAARIAGWISVLIVLSQVTATHYNNAGTAALLLTAGLMVLGLLWDARKRRRSWRR